MVEAETGLAAIGRANATHPDLITMDLGLPDMTGDEAIARLKADPSTTHIPVIVITAYYGGAPPGIVANKRSIMNSIAARFIFFSLRTA